MPIWIWGTLGMIFSLMLIIAKETSFEHQQSCTHIQNNFMDVIKVSFFHKATPILLHFERGFFWTKEQGAVLGDSQFYIALHNIMPIWIWAK
jgi:hypothetical protein